MRLPGYCTRCGKFRYVRVNSYDLALAAAGRKVMSGVCHECEAPTTKVVKR